MKTREEIEAMLDRMPDGAITDEQDGLETALTWVLGHTDDRRVLDIING